MPGAAWKVYEETSLDMIVVDAQPTPLPIAQIMKACGIAARVNTSWIRVLVPRIAVPSRSDMPCLIKALWE